MITYTTLVHEVETTGRNNVRLSRYRNIDSPLTSLAIFAVLYVDHAASSILPTQKKKKTHSKNGSTYDQTLGGQSSLQIEGRNLNELLRLLYQSNTYWNSKMILHNVDLFICEAFDDYFMAQTLRFFIGMFQDTKIVITVLLLFVRFPRIC